MKPNKTLMTLLAALAIAGGTADAVNADHMMIGPMMGGGWGSQMMGPCAGAGMMGGAEMMMGPGMMGPGMMGGVIPNLTDEQRKKIANIQDDQGDQHWDLMKKMRAERYKLQELLYADREDPEAIRNQYKKLAELHQQMIDSSLDAHKQISALLTKEQKEALKTWRRGWMMQEQ
jgi:Spy/CpxP family protein refolding chaperone